MNEDYFCTVTSSGQIQLRSSKRSGVIQTLGHSITSAIIQGNQIVATTKSGNTSIFEIKNGYAILKKTF
tara:strand:+ start:1314 stop:1520 length:207 start_codon:yes stop_codon:yes gene_type:complete